MTSERQVLVAGVGNVFLGDDGFGVAVARELAARALPPGVRVLDAGTRAVHLAYETAGCDLLILVDASARGEPAGTVTLLEPDSGPGGETGAGAFDPHGITADGVLALVHRLGTAPARTLVVACEPADLGPGMELSGPVRAAVPEAVRMVESIVGEG